jgi:hypothetical protein
LFTFTQFRGSLELGFIIFLFFLSLLWFGFGLELIDWMGEERVDSEDPIDVSKK